MKKLAVFAIRFYQAAHGALFTGTCRFYPTCSHYAVEAIETRGLITGFFLTAYRVLRCQPFCKGGWDPVPAAPQAKPLGSNTPKVWNTLRIASSAGQAFAQPRPQIFRRRT